MNQYQGPSIPPIDVERVRSTVERFVAKLQGRGIVLFLIALAVIGAFTSYYQIGSDEVGVVTRFGRYQYTTPPGLHLKLPFGVDRVESVPVERQLKAEFGFRTVRPDVRTEKTVDSGTRQESVMLTGDLNVANVQWIVQYKVRNAYKFLFRARNVVETFRDMTEASMRQVVGDHSVTEVLTVGREAIQHKAKSMLQQMCDQYGIGVEVLQLVLKDVNPPDQVRDSFNEVNQAIQERERLVNQALAEYNRVIPESRGKAEQSIRAAEGYAAARINRAKGDAESFSVVESEYRKAPKVTRTRLYHETMQEVLPKASRQTLLDPSLKGLLPVFTKGAAGAANNGVSR